jgi:hypothetical protein
MPYIAFPGQGLPDEIIYFVPVSLVVAIVAVLFAGKRDEDSESALIRSRYFAAIGLLTVFVSVFAAYTAVQALTDLLVDHEDRVESTGNRGVDGELSIAEVYEGAPPYVDELDDDENYRVAVESGVLAITLAVAFALHVRARRSFWPDDETTTDGVIARVRITAMYGASFVAALTAALAGASMLFGVFQFAAPEVVGATNAEVGRAEGIAALVAAAILLAAMVALIRWVWDELAPPLPDEEPREESVA